LVKLTLFYVNKHSLLDCVKKKVRKIRIKLVVGIDLVTELCRLSVI